MQLSTPRKQYPILDFARLFCAFLIVVLHAFEVPKPYTVWEFLCACFYEQAVPFFFVVSGFFFAKKLEACEYDLRVVWQYVRGRLLLYLAWTVLWMPYLVHIYLDKYPDGSALYIAALLLRRIFVAGSGVYWYLLVMAEAAAIIGLLMRFKLEKLLYALAVIGLVLRYFYDLQLDVPVIAQINQAFYYVFSWSNNVIMDGLPFMTVGLFFARHMQKTVMPPSALAVAYLGVSSVHIYWYFVVGITAGNLSCSFLFPIQTICLFWLGLQRETDSSVRAAQTARELSAVVYFMHTVFIYGVFDALRGVDSSVAVKFFGSIALSVVVYVLVRLVHWKPLYWLFSMKYTKRIRASEETAA